MEKEEERENARRREISGNITEEERENFNAAKVGWGTRKAIKETKAKIFTPLVIPQIFISICGIRFDISNKSLEDIFGEAIRLKLDIYHISEDYGAIKCPDGIYELVNENE